MVTLSLLLQCLDTCADDKRGYRWQLHGRLRAISAMQRGLRSHALPGVRRLRLAMDADLQPASFCKLLRCTRRVLCAQYKEGSTPKTHWHAMSVK